MKKKFMNSVTALVTAGILFGVGGAMILTGAQLDHRQKTAYKLALQEQEAQLASMQLAAAEDTDGSQVSIEDQYPPLSEAPELDDPEGMEASESGSDESGEGMILPDEGEQRVFWLNFGNSSARAEAETEEDGTGEEDVTYEEDGVGEETEIEESETPLASHVEIGDQETPLSDYDSSSDESGQVVDIDGEETTPSDISGMPQASGISVEQSPEAVIDYSNTSDGYVMVNWTGDGSAKVKVLLKDPSGTTYQYDLHPGKGYEVFPLTSGNGNYNVGVYKNISGTKYSTVITKDISVSLSSELAPYVIPNQYVNYNSTSAAISKAAGLCTGKSDVLEKVAAVYEYVINNLTYDKNKAATVQSGYLPVIDETLSTGKGICFDYSSLMAAMLRSQHVPTKLVVGYAKQAYHAWINVWSDEEGWITKEIHFDGNEWKLMDPTFASTGGQTDSVMQYIGNGKNYRPKYQY